MLCFYFLREEACAKEIISQKPLRMFKKKEKKRKTLIFPVDSLSG